MFRPYTKENTSRAPGPQILEATANEYQIVFVSSNSSTHLENTYFQLKRLPNAYILNNVASIIVSSIWINFTIICHRNAQSARATAYSQSVLFIFRSGLFTKCISRLIWTIYLLYNIRT